MWFFGQPFLLTLVKLIDFLFIGWTKFEVVVDTIFVIDLVGLGIAPH